MFIYSIFIGLSLNILFAQDTTFYCNDWAQESIESYIIENNVWGAGSLNNYDQCIYITDNSMFGWTWDWPNEGYHVKSYPEVMFGKKPWSSTSTHPSMPLKAVDVESFIVDFDLEMEAEGSYNLAFEFWVTSDSLSDHNGITTEVMIWTAGEGLQAAGEHISTPYFDGYFYKLYRAEFDNWIYYAFVSEEDQFSGTLNIHNFINYMISTDHLTAHEFIANFEMGNEVVYGTGQTDIKAYSVSVNQQLMIKDLSLNASSFKLNNPTPNPFNPSTTISYEINNPNQVSMSIYDLNGKLVRSLMNRYHDKGSFSINWDGKNNHGDHISAGLYILKMMSGNLDLRTKKITLLK